MAHEKEKIPSGLKKTKTKQADDQAMTKPYLIEENDSTVTKLISQ